MQHIIVFYRTLTKIPRNITTENVTTGATVDRTEGNSQAESNDVMNKFTLTNSKVKDKSNGKICVFKFLVWDRSLFCCTKCLTFMVGMSDICCNQVGKLDLLILLSR